MRKKEILNSMNLIDEKYVEEAAPHNARPFLAIARKRTKQLIIIAASISVIAILSMSILVSTLLSDKTTHSPDASNNSTQREEEPKETKPIKIPPVDPVFVDGPVCTYEEFVKLMADDPNNGTVMGEPTNQYTSVFIPDKNILLSNSLPFDQPVKIFDRVDVSKPLDENELKQISDPIVERYCKAVGQAVPEYGFWRQTRYDNEEVIRNDIETNDIGNRTLSLDQYDDRHSISFWAPQVAKNEEEFYLFLDGIKVQVDQRKNDEEIIKDIEPIKKKLFDIFGVTFNDIKINRIYSDASSSIVEYFQVYFYDKSDHELDGMIFDNILLQFENQRNASYDYVSDATLFNVSVLYTKYRCDPYEICYPTKITNLIALQKAEEYLRKGYVVNPAYNYECPICIAFQEKIDFENYDFVTLKYQTYYKSVIPFYRFYKQIDGDKYAVTSIPAIEISGYSEHFESIQNNHEHKTQ